MIRNIPRYNENPACGMVADDLGRWVTFVEHNKAVLELESQINALAYLLAQHQGRSSVYWRELARRELEKT
ncbi:MAG: hypothetical protein E7022_05940 [Desulfovibrio desulfuricans]|nr:hypothetical protein [Desulfovibrio desulfuricans]